MKHPNYKLSHPYFIGLLESHGHIQINHFKIKYLKYRIVLQLNYNSFNYNLITIIKKSYGRNTTIY